MKPKELLFFFLPLMAIWLIGLLCGETLLFHSKDIHDPLPYAFAGALCTAYVVVVIYGEYKKEKARLPK